MDASPDCHFEDTSSPSADDGEFRRLAHERDLAPAYAILSRLRPRLCRFLLHQFGGDLGGEAGVEEIVCDTLRKALLKAYQFDPERGSLRTWLLRIATNTALDEIADTRRCQTGVSEETFERHPRAELEDDQRLVALRRAIERLPQRERVILKARYRKKPLQDRELSEKLGCTVGHVHNVRSRVLKGLRQTLRDE